MVNRLTTINAKLSGAGNVLLEASHCQSQAYIVILGVLHKLIYISTHYKRKILDGFRVGYGLKAACTS